MSGVSQETVAVIETGIIPTVLSVSSLRDLRRSAGDVRERLARFEDMFDVFAWREPEEPAPRSPRPLTWVADTLQMPPDRAPRCLRVRRRTQPASAPRGLRSVIAGAPIATVRSESCANCCTGIDYLWRDAAERQVARSVPRSVWCRISFDTEYSQYITSSIRTNRQSRDRHEAPFNPEEGADVAH